MKVGFTCSSFDLLHAGHILMLEEAKQHCDFLVVGLQTDPTIDRPEKNKPIQSYGERFIQVSAVSYVDDVFEYDTEESLLKLLSLIAIDIRFIGIEYLNKDFTGKQYCLDNGIELHYNSRNHSYSTTELRNRIYEAELLKRYGV